MSQSFSLAKVTYQESEIDTKIRQNASNRITLFPKTSTGRHPRTHLYRREGVGKGKGTKTCLDIFMEILSAEFFGPVEFRRVGRCERTFMDQSTSSWSLSKCRPNGCCIAAYLSRLG
jgi:hypothetical protein